MPMTSPCDPMTGTVPLVETSDVVGRCGRPLPKAMSAGGESVEPTDLADAEPTDRVNDRAGVMSPGELPPREALPERRREALRGVLSSCAVVGAPTKRSASSAESSPCLRRP